MSSKPLPPMTPIERRDYKIFVCRLDELGYDRNGRKRDHVGSERHYELFLLGYY